MIKKLKLKMFSNFNDNRIKYFVVLGIFFAGLTAGSISDTQAENLDGFNYIRSFISSYKLQGVSGAEIFLRAGISYIRLFFILWLSGRAVWLIPINLMQVGAKGFGIGFTIAYMVRWGGFYGFALGLIMLFLQNIIFIPALIIYSVYQMNFAINYRSTKHSASLFRQKRKMILGDIKAMAVIISAIILCSCIEAYIIPELIMPMCMFFK